MTAVNIVEDLPAALDRWVAEALQLRFTGPQLSAPATGPADVLAVLTEIRGRLDRVEELLAGVLRVRGRVSRAHAATTAEADDAWDRAAMARRSAPLARGDEFSSARERTAEANLATLDQRVAARRSGELASRCDEAADVLRLAHRGLDGQRQDLLAALRAVAFESHLDR